MPSRPPFEATRADALVFLSRRASCAPGRLAVSHGAGLSGAERQTLVSPTIVFEDDSIRFAGTWFDSNEQKLRRPIHRIIRATWCMAPQPAEVMAGSTACCIISKSAIEARPAGSR